MPEKRRYYKELRISQLRAFLHLARSGGFAAAATQLDLSTPTVWNQIRALEDEFKLKLVDVSGRTVHLTEHGKRLANLATPVVEGFDSLAERYAEEAGMLPKKLSIASPSNILVNELPSPFRTYRERYPEVELNLIDVPSVTARKLVEEGGVDIAVAGLIDRDMPADMEINRVTEFPFVLACQQGHPLLAMERITPKSIVKYPLILSSEGTNTRRRIDQIFGRSDLTNRMKIACQTSTKELCLQYVEMGFGVTIAPLSPRYLSRAKSLVSDSNDSSKLAFRDLSKIFGTEPIVVMHRSDRYEAEHQKAFRELVIQLVD